MGPEFSLYDILGVRPSATSEEIKNAYRASVLKYHPDVNKAPNAQRLTEMLNAAYEVLSDPAKRKTYDDDQAPDGSAPHGPGEATPQLWDLLTCDSCGRADPHLRFANFFRVWSIVLYTQMKGVGGVLCPTCRSAKATSSALFSATLGPWGFPWGIIYTLRALSASVRGGELPALENAQLLRHQAVAYLQRGRYNEAKTNFKASLQFEPSAQVSAMLAERFIQEATTLEARSWLRGQTIALASISIPVFLAFLIFVPHGFDAGGSKTSTPAASSASNVTGASSDAASSGPDSTDTHGRAVQLNNQGLALAEAGKTDLALAAYNKALELDSTDAVLYYNRALVRRRKRQLDLAIADLTKAIALKPDDADFYNSRGLSYSSEQKERLAIKDFTQGLRLKPVAFLYYNRGTSYANLKEYEPARADLTASISLDPKNSDTYRDRGFIEHQMGNNGLAVADYLVALKSKPSDPYLLLDSGIAYEALGDEAAALNLYDRAVKSDPSLRSLLKAHSSLYAARR